MKKFISYLVFLNLQFFSVGKLFSRSKSRNNLIYTDVLCDGDVSNLSTILKLDPYRNEKIVVRKTECVNHLAKRVPANIDSLRKDHPSLFGRKGPLGGKKWPTKIRCEIGSIFRKNHSSVEELRNNLEKRFMHWGADDEHPKMHAKCDKHLCKALQNKGE